jgi:hypothetical protein
MTVEWNGQLYAVPEKEPPQVRDPELLHPLFRAPLEQWVVFAQRFTPLEIRVGETLRTLERQCWLFALGRSLPGPVRSWTLNSKHRWGLAADLILVDRLQNTAVWDESVWRKLYADAPPQWFGLTPISKELVHLESMAAAQIIDRATELGMRQA